jgi:hypothetical protein
MRSARSTLGAAARRAMFTRGWRSRSTPQRTTWRRRASSRSRRRRCRACFSITRPTARAPTHPLCRPRRGCHREHLPALGTSTTHQPRASIAPAALDPPRARAGSAAHPRHRRHDPADPGAVRHHQHRDQPRHGVDVPHRAHDRDAVPRATSSRAARRPSCARRAIGTSSSSSTPDRSRCTDHLRLQRDSGATPALTAPCRGAILAGHSADVTRDLQTISPCLIATRRQGERSPRRKPTNPGDPGDATGAWVTDAPLVRSP